MSMKNVVDFFEVVKESRALQRKTHMAADIDTIVKIAAAYDLKFNSTELQTFLGRMPAKDLAAAVNPGIGNRLHMSPR
jgi:Nif11 domain